MSTLNLETLEVDTFETQAESSLLVPIGDRCTGCVSTCGIVGSAHEFC